MNGTTGTVDIPLTDFPTAAVTTDSTTATVQSGTSDFLGPGTPVGDRYGSSQGKEYVTLRTATGLTPSTATLTFEHPTNAGNFAFTPGGIDADSVTVAATGADGRPLTVDRLGRQGTFNQCQARLKPSACGPAGTDTDVPSWDPATNTLVGHGSDTTGASGWFQPTVPVTGITLKFGRQTGFPVYQLWISSLLADRRPRHRRLRPAHRARGAAPGRERAARPGPDGQAVTTTTDDQGNHAFTNPAPGHYQVSTTSDAYAPPTSSRTADTSDGNSVIDADLALTCRTNPSPSTTVSSTPTCRVFRPPHRGRPLRPPRHGVPRRRPLLGVVGADVRLDHLAETRHRPGTTKSRTSGP